MNAIQHGSYTLMNAIQHGSYTLMNGIQHGSYTLMNAIQHGSYTIMNAMQYYAQVSVTEMYQTTNTWTFTSQQASMLAQLPGFGGLAGRTAMTQSLAGQSALLPSGVLLPGTPYYLPAGLLPQAQASATHASAGAMYNPALSQTAGLINYAAAAQAAAAAQQAAVALSAATGSSQAQGQAAVDASSAAHAAAAAAGFTTATTTVPATGGQLLTTAAGAHNGAGQFLTPGAPTLPLNASTGFQYVPTSGGYMPTALTGLYYPALAAAAAAQQQQQAQTQYYSLPLDMNNFQDISGGMSGTASVASSGVTPPSTSAYDLAAYQAAASLAAAQQVVEGQK